MANNMKSEFTWATKYIVKMSKEAREGREREGERETEGRPDDKQERGTLNTERAALGIVIMLNN